MPALNLSSTLAAACSSSLGLLLKKRETLTALVSNLSYYDARDMPLFLSRCMAGPAVGYWRLYQGVESGWMRRNIGSCASSKFYNTIAVVK